MNKKVNAVISYLDYELRLVVYSIFDEKPYVIFDEDIDRININTIKSDIERQKVINNIYEVIKKFEKLYSISLDVLNICFDPEKYLYSKKVYTFEFEQTHRITRGDIKKVYKQAYSNGTTSEGYIVSDFSISSYLINDSREVLNPIGSDVSKLQVVGEVVCADSKTYYALTSLIEATNIEVGKVIVGNYMIKKNCEITDKQMLVDINKETITFSIFDGTEIKQTTTSAGYRKFSEELYKKLLENYNKEDAEKGVRFIIEYFVLKEYPIDLHITPTIKLNSIVNEYKRIIKKYFVFILQELKRQELGIENAYVLLKDYDETEFIELLSEDGKTVFEPYEPSIKNFEEKKNYKIRYAISEIISAQKIMETE